MLFIGTGQKIARMWKEVYTPGYFVNFLSLFLFSCVLYELVCVLLLFLCHFLLSFKINAYP